MPRASRADEVLTMEEAGQVLDVTPRTVRRWIADRGLPHSKIGKEIRILRTSLLAWVKAQEQVKPGAVGSANG